MDLDALSDEELIALYRQEKARVAASAPAQGAGGAEDWGPDTRVLPNGAVIHKGPKGGVTVLRQPTVRPGSDPTNPLFQRVGAEGNLAADERKELATFRGAAREAGGMIRDVDRFVDLNREAATGWPYSIPVVGDALVGLSPQVQEMRSLSERMTPAQREVGSGAMSDRDVEMYRRSVVNINQMGRTNENVAVILRTGAERQREYSAFMEEWARANGSLVGAQERWSEYTAENPLFQEDGNGNIVLRRGVPNWRQYFARQKASPAPGYQTGANARPRALPAAQRGSQAPAARSPAPGQPQRQQAAQRPANGAVRGASGAEYPAAMMATINSLRPSKEARPGSRQNPRLVFNRRDFDALPRGAWFIDEDGGWEQKP
jgi:hypothetical protein